MIGKYADMMQLNIKSISHFQFADDTLVLEKKKKCWVCVRAKRVVQFLFGLITDLKVNFNKNLMLGVNVNDLWLAEATVVLNCRIGRFLFVQFGMPIGGDDG